LEPLEKKFEAFGFCVKSCNGHDFSEIDEALKDFPFEKGFPSILIADTIRGKGLPSIEEKADRWFCNFTRQEIDNLLLELHGKHITDLNSEKIIPR
jgi:transketolase